MREYKIYVVHLKSNPLANVDPLNILIRDIYIWHKSMTYEWIENINAKMSFSWGLCMQI
jgi:hypothetical protein